VERLESILAILLEAGLSPFQANLKGEQRPIVSRDQPLDFGIGTIFVHDPDGNIVEFVERGRGIFALLK
jgi:catechol 2,3-dioxygenase-like lactoylglutathione lyase family enzyme